MSSEDAPLPPGPRLPPPEADDGRDIPDAPPRGAAPAVEQGLVLTYRLYDVAEEIDLPEVERTLQREAATTRLKLLRENSQYLELRNPPVSVSLGTRELALGERKVPGELRARVFDHGAIAFSLRLTIPPGTPFERLVALSDELYDNAALDALCRTEVEQLSRRLGAALRKPHLWSGDESYTVIFLQKLQGIATAVEILERCDIARLLLGEQHQQISRQQRRDVMRHSHSYSEADLAVIDWNSAFVFEPSGLEDIPDILEVANAQLLELRYYDDLLDRELEQIYDVVNVTKKPWWSIFSSKYSRLRRRTSALTLELGEFTERVENSLKVIGDFYLARVYQAAVRRLRINDWAQSVYRKESSVAQVYSLLKSEVDTDRLLWLELTVVLLILGELLLALHVV